MFSSEVYETFAVIQSSRRYTADSEGRALRKPEATKKYVANSTTILLRLRLATNAGSKSLLPLVVIFVLIARAFCLVGACLSMPYSVRRSVRLVCHFVPSCCFAEDVTMWETDIGESQQQCQDCILSLFRESAPSRCLPNSNVDPP